MSYTICSCCLLLSLLVLIYVRYHMHEYFRLSKELTQKYLAIREKDLKAKYGKQAWDHCMHLMKLQLRWSPNESEVPTIEKKEFPCGNTVEKCLINVTEDIKNGEPIEPLDKKIIAMANS